MPKLSRISAGFVFVGLMAVLPALGQMSAVVGTVTDTSGKPIVGATVAFDRQDVSGHWQVKTNKKGQYGHYGLPLGTFKITLIGPDGKELFHLNNVRTHLGDPLVQDFDMRKEAQNAAANQMQGMSKEQREQYQKQQSQQAAATAKLGKLNGLLAQEKQFNDAKQYDQAAQVMQQAASEIEAGGTAGLRGAEIVYVHLGDDYMHINQPQKAVDAYTKAIAANPNNGSFYIQLGNAQLKTGQTQQAVASFEKGAALAPTPKDASTAYYNEGVSFYNTNKVDEAAAAFDKAIKADPTDANAYYYKGLALLSKGTTDPQTGKVNPAPGTVEALQKYLELQPNGPNAEGAKAVLGQLSGGVETSFKKRKTK